MARFGTKVANDEWYTTEYTAEYVVNKYIKWLEGKKIILPCDSEWSELYKACKRHNLDCEISRDMYNVDYNKYDLCFTNPPFHGIAKYIRFLLNNNVKFLLFAPWTICKDCAAKTHDFYHVVYYLERSTPGGTKLSEFKRPDGTIGKVQWGLVTDLPEGKQVVLNKPDIRIKATNEYQHYHGIWSDLTKCNYLKYDCYMHCCAKDPEYRLRVKNLED